MRDVSLELPAEKGSRPFLPIFPIVEAVHQPIEPQVCPPTWYGTHFSMIRATVLLFLLFSVGLYAQTVEYTLQGATPSYFGTFRQFGNQERDRIFSDFGYLYNCNNVKNFGLAVMGGAVLANTEMDRNFQNWHNKHIQSDTSDEFSKVAKVFGEGAIFIPVITTSAVAYRFSQVKWGLSDRYLGEFTDRTTRAYLSGAPTLLTFQLLLGGNRPEHGDSYWRPFRQDHGVSGHAFLGAVPFMTIAQMADQTCVKGLFYALSGFTAWSRINDDRHYLSQALLGWYLAYLSVRAVSQTEASCALPQGLTLFPVCVYDSVGVGLYYQY